MFSHRYMGRDLARLFGKSAAWVSMNLARLMEKDRFPQPIRGAKNRWDAAEVDAWFRHEEAEASARGEDQASGESLPASGSQLITRGALRAALRSGASS